MHEQQQNKSEKYISKTFDGMSNFFDKSDSKGLDKTASRHINKIVNESSKKALDVGSGAGGILEGLLDKNLDYVYGVELSPKMIDLATKRLEKKGYLTKSKMDNVSFLNYSFPDQVDAISLHKVLCCHPDRSGMLQKAISGKPNVIVITIPRNWHVFRFGVAIFHLFRKVKHGFTFYVHNPKVIDKELQEANYELVDVFKTFIWITRTYKLQSN